MFLDIGEPVFVMTADLIRLSSLKPEREISVRTVRLPPREPLHQEFVQEQKNLTNPS